MLLAFVLTCWTLVLPAQADCGGWQIVPTAPVSTTGGGVSLSDVAAGSPTDAWAVGTRPNESGHQTLTEHWDGNAWRFVLSPRASTLDNGLNAVAAVGPDDVWSVGYKRPTGGLFKTLTVHWDGTAWGVVRSRNQGSSDDTLVDVSALSTADVWAVGGWFNGTGYRPLVEHWDGDAWSVVRAAPPGTGDSSLLAVAAVSPGDVWAAGYSAKRRQQPDALIDHWDGNGWTQIGFPGGSSVITGLSAAAPDDVWAAGYSYTGATYRALVAHWDGSSWSEEAPPSLDGPFSFLRKVAEVSADDVWAAGVAYDPSAGDYVTFTEHWDGSTWSIVPSPNGSSLGQRSNELIGLGAVPGTTAVWSVGGYGVRPLALTTCGPPGSVPTGAVRAAVNETVTERGPVPSLPVSSIRANPPPQSRTPIARSAPETVAATDQGSAAGIEETTRTWSAVVADFDGDGLPDLFLVRHQWPARLYLNEGGSFVEIDEGSIAPGDRHDCGAADFNGDGRLDLFCSVGAARGTRVKSDELWFQQPDLTFSPAAATAHVLDPFGRGRWGTILDANGDGAPDVFVGNEEFRPDGLPAPNRLFVNEGDGSFADEPASGLDRQIGSSCASTVDYNGDGWDDLLLCSALHGLLLYRNNAGNGFTDVTSATGLNGAAPTSAEMSDLNGDGMLDLVEIFPTELDVLLQQPTGVLVPAFTRSLTSGVSVAVGDVNGDQRMDLYVVQGSLGGQNIADVMLVNDGDGTSFSELPIPETSVGSGDVAVPIDYDGNGLTDFVVLNGKVESSLGPIQLIAFAPAPG